MRRGANGYTLLLHGEPRLLFLSLISLYLFKFCIHYVFGLL